MKPALLLSVFCLAAFAAPAATLVVTTTSDHPVDGCDAECSLREAVIAANATVEHDTIVVPAGTYVLDLVGSGEEAAATGDLDLNEDVTIAGDPAGGTVIDGNLSDRLVHLNGATVELTDLILTRGTTTSDFYGAGGILVESGTLTMTRCMLSDCTTNHYGGGLFSLGTVTIDRSAVTGNTAYNGGGIYHAGSNLTLGNSTVSGNTATTGGSGGVSIDGLAMAASFTSCTISNNHGVESDAVSIRTAVTVANTIFDGSCAVIAGMGVVSSEGGNLESPADTCDLGHASDQAGVSAVALDLGPLQDNGGITPTHALHSGSTAIDSGSNVLCPAVDQRDLLRWDGGCDVGAYELGARGSVLFADGFESGDTNAWSNGRRPSKLSRRSFAVR